MHTTQYRLRHIIFGNLARSEYVTLVDGPGTPYENTAVSNVSSGEDAMFSKRPTSRAAWIL